MTHTYEIAGMHCASCVQRITEALQRVEGVLKAHVTLSPPRAVVQMQRHIPFSELNDTLNQVGAYRLTEQGSSVESLASTATTEADDTSFFPLILILAYLTGTVALVAWTTRDFTLHSLMTWFMGGFFLIFSFFKLLDLNGFVGAYRSYDIVAKASPTWAYSYPFVELALGVGYIANWNPAILNSVTLVVMLIGSIGVLRALFRRIAIRCACLGTVLKLPMTKVTLVEDLGMAVMAAIMLVIAR